MKTKEHKKRSGIRFIPDPNTLIWVSDSLSSQEFEPKIVGLVVNESHTGCGAVFIKSQTYDQLKVGEKYFVAVGALSPVASELKWIKNIDDEVLRMGFEYHLKSS